jgi:hypothetical protein
MSSINEACEGNVNISTLDPFKKNEFLVEGTEKMQNEIARCRQIMYNAAMIMNESTEISAKRKSDGTVMYDGKNDEAPTGKKGDEGYTKGTAKQEIKSNTNGVKKNCVPFTEKASVNEGASCCPNCGKNPCECTNCNEEAGDIGDNPLMPNTENWGTEGIGKGRDPQSVGWEMDGQKRVNEEEDDWASKGLPSSPGVGDADTSHNNDPFNKSINEEEDDDNQNSDVESEPSEPEDNENGEEGEYFDNDTDFEGTEDTEDFGDGENDENSTDFDSGLDDFSDDDFSEDYDESDFDTEDGEGEDEEDLRSEIEDLKAEIEALKAQINGESDDEFADSGESDFGDDEFGDDEFGDDKLGDDEFDEESVEFGGDDLDSNYEFGGEGGEDFSTEGEDYEEDDDFSEETPYDDDEERQSLQERKSNRIDRIVESVIKKVLKEDELHYFGKHPGYRKQPMQLPTTGEDKNQWGEDWNDESVHSEEPFGSKIGNGDPFNNLVNAITKDVMYQLKAGIPIEGKKKAE